MQQEHMELPKKPWLEILEQCKIGPSPSPPTPFSLPLTYFDLSFFLSPPTQRILFYSLPPHELLHFYSILQTLKHSLSHALSHFLPLAGNLVWPPQSPEPFICYNPGDSLSLTIAKTHADFHHLSSNHARKAKESHFLVPDLPTSDTIAPVMSLQITLFPKCGFSIGIITNHVVSDAKTSTMFLKSWASICSTLNNTNNKNPPTLPSELTPCFDRTPATDPNGLHTLYVKSFAIFVPNPKLLGLTPKEVISDDVVYATFELTRIDIEKLRRRVVATSSSTPRRLSTFMLAFSLVSTCIVKAQRTEPESKIGLIFLVDWRARMDVLGWLNYFGNGVNGYGLFVEARELEGENGMAMISNKISDALAEIEKNMKENKGVEMLDEISERWKKAMPIDKFVLVAGSPRLGVYDIDFGWGRSKKVELASISPNGVFSMAESRNGDGGVELGISLPSEAVDKFCSLFSETMKGYVD
ncbi:malonyl-CoA:anthocyanidin 5-O-glucoside-6''-O-malonyltransferase-like [Cucurbita moschata]|uniref:Malonyl-CoA:anthocyanidin 5-O-glucoside-6''-O-malonyltransferase-like n=1 Tax=Cucurbita moschata TaxID=3662 RepID=A0A6J1FVL4_CUCMO|nr:malonyl-CoA:anthocyanidin 5-O-glucoside-6''-O-malonyltransferase-like [Cucurbita moschata]